MYVDLNPIIAGILESTDNKSRGGIYAAPAHFSNIRLHEPQRHDVPCPVVAQLRQSVRLNLATPPSAAPLLLSLGGVRGPTW
jgi:hypothetical protein